MVAFFQVSWSFFLVLFMLCLLIVALALSSLVFIVLWCNQMKKYSDYEAFFFKLSCLLKVSDRLQCEVMVLLGTSI
jgi:hypothetical protein